MLHGRFAYSLITATILLGFLGAARAAEPSITIGFGIALTGGLAPNGKAALFAMEIWQDEVNAHGALLGRPVKLVYYDDQTNPATVPGIYTRLLDVDKDLVISKLRHQHDRAGDAGRHAAQPHPSPTCSSSTVTMGGP